MSIDFWNFTNMFRVMFFPRLLFFFKFVKIWNVLYIINVHSTVKSTWAELLSIVMISNSICTLYFMYVDGWLFTHFRFRFVVGLMLLTESEREWRRDEVCFCFWCVWVNDGQRMLIMRRKTSDENNGFYMKSKEKQFIYKKIIIWLLRKIASQSDTLCIVWSYVRLHVNWF